MGRLSHRPKADLVNPLMFALTGEFALTGVAAALLKQWKMVVPGAIPYPLSGQAATLGKKPPVWSSTPSYSFTAGVAQSAVALPVSVPGGGTPTITVAWHSSSTPSTKPAWVTLTSGAAPTIAFTSASVAGSYTMILSAVANGQTVLSGSSTVTVAAESGLGLNIVAFNSNEGSVYGYERLRTGPMGFEHAIPTRDGTLIEAFTGAHGEPYVANRVGEYDPTSGIPYSSVGAMTDVFPSNSSPSAFLGAFGAEAYDNHSYTYFDAVDSFIDFDTMGQYQRSAADDGAGSRWIRYQDPTFPPLGRRPVATDSTSVDGLIYCPTATLTSFLYRCSMYNTPTAYNKMLDIGILIGGSKNPGGPMDYSEHNVSVIIPSRYINTSIVSRYYAISKAYGRATAGGVPYTLFNGRATIVCLNQYVYWGGGRDETDASKPYFFRSDLSKIINAVDPTAVSFTSLVERLQDSPVSHNASAMAVDPYSNGILLFTQSGVYLYDVTLGSWSTITDDPKIAEYKSTMGGYYIDWPHAGFINERNGSYFDDKGFVVQRLGTSLKKTYWFGGRWQDGGQWPERLQKVRSIKLGRGQTVTALNVTFEDPTNTNATTHNMFEDSKHQMIVQNYLPTYLETADVDRRLYLMSGDFQGWPSGQRADYPTTPYWSYSGRQDAWFADVSTAAINSGTLRFKLAQNYYHNYPWNGSTGYFGPGRPGGGTEPTRGPLQPDGCGLFVDKRGQIWHGPSFSKYDQNYGTEAGGVSPTYAPMYKWSMPDLHSNGVRLGGSADGTKGWSLPSQNRLQLYNVSGVGEYDIAISSSESTSLARPNFTPYDPAGDKCYVVGVLASSTQLQVHLYSMSLDPTVVAGQGGQYQWVQSALGSIPLKQIGLTNAASADPPNDDMHNGDIGGVVWCNGSIYFPFTCAFNVPSGYGNASSTYLRKAWILKVTPGANQSAAPTVDWLPFPEVQPWFLRQWDGPLAAETYARNPGEYGTTGQYRTLQAVGSKLVLGPDFETNVTKDPWICVYDTTTKVWTPWGAPADYAITNGGQDWPCGVFNFHAVPSLGECWLIGRNGSGDDYDPNTSYIVNNGLHNRQGYENANGVKLGRRIIRFKVN